MPECECEDCKAYAQTVILYDIENELDCLCEGCCHTDKERIQLVLQAIEKAGYELHARTR